MSGPHEHAEDCDAIERGLAFKPHWMHQSERQRDARAALVRIRAELAELEQARADLRVYEEWKRIANAHPGFLARDSMHMAKRAALGDS
jgi:hypothetical protein